MKCSLTQLNRHNFKASPPKAAPRTSLQVESQDAPLLESVTLSALAKPNASTGKASDSLWLKTLMAVSAFTALAGPAMAQTPPGVAPLIEQSIKSSEGQLAEADCCNKPVAPVDLSVDRAVVASDSTKTKFAVTGNFVNDNMPTFMVPSLGGPEHKTPDGDFFDDDGWTAELRLETNFQRGDSELFVGGRLMMATETGSWDSSNTEFAGRRTDVGEIIAQRNERTSLGSNTTLDYGLGGGLQGVGNIGGESVQRWWHDVGAFGGRTGTDLQGNQTNDSFRVIPVVTAGSKLTFEATPNLDFKIAGQATVPIGRGLGNVGLKSGVVGQAGPVSLELGGKLDGTWSNAPELDFMNIDGVRPGVYGRVEVQSKNMGGIFAQVETGGFRNEPTLSVGIRFGGASGARLNPFQ